MSKWRCVCRRVFERSDFEGERSGVEGELCEAQRLKTVERAPEKGELIESEHRWRVGREEGCLY